jgi:hypothetical protein
MPPLKTSATVLSKTPFVKIPRIAPPVTRTKQPQVYCDWLGNLLTVRQNMNVFLRSEKQVVDECFRLQATQQFPCGSVDLEKALAEVSGIYLRYMVDQAKLCQIDCIHSKAFWNSKMKTARNDTSSSGSSGTELKQSLEHLTLPWIEPARGVSNNDLWRTQTYADFAQKVQRNNPNTLLTKNVVDSAFRLAITRVNKGSESLPGRDSAISRVSHVVLCNSINGLADQRV